MPNRKEVEQQTIKAQSYLVVKSNEIIQKSRDNLTTKQLKILAFFISKIKREDEANTLYISSIQEYCRVSNIDYTSGNNYKDIRKSIKDIADRSIWIEQDGIDILLRWFDKIHIAKKSGLISVRFSEDIHPYLFELKERYTAYSLANILPMKSKWAIKLFELLKSYEYTHNPIPFEVEELKKLLGAEKYTRFPDFRRYVLNKAKDDINTYSDYEIDYTLRKNHSRSYNQIIFTIYEQSGYNAVMKDRIRKRALREDK